MPYPTLNFFACPPALLVSQQGDPAFAESAKEKSPPSERKRTPFFGAFFKQLLDPNVSVNDRVTEFFAAALGKAISKMYESMGESLWKRADPQLCDVSCVLRSSFFIELKPHTRICSCNGSVLRFEARTGCLKSPQPHLAR